MGVNKVILVGRLGKDPELRYTQSQTPVASFSLATGDRRKDPGSGSWVEHTEWHNVVTFGKTAENCNNYLQKGKEVFIEGRIQTRKWQDKEGKDRWTTEVVANNVQFLGGRDGQGAQGQGAQGGGGSYQGASNSDAQAAAPNPLDSLPSADAVSAGGKSGGDVSFDDDDIPF